MIKSNRLLLITVMAYQLAYIMAFLSDEHKSRTAKYFRELLNFKKEKNKHMEVAEELMNPS